MKEYVQIISGASKASMTNREHTKFVRLTRADSSPGEGWKEVVKHTPKPVPGQGQELGYTYTVDGDYAHKEYFLVPEGASVVRVYSKLKILLAAKAAGFLPDLIAMIEADPETKWIWDASNTIEDNELLAAYLPAVAEAIGKTPEEVRAFLDANCLAD